MKEAAEYLAHVKALAVANWQVTHCIVVREEALGSSGLFRLRLTLRDGGLLEAFERFSVADGCPQVSKYRFHWQDASGQMRKRWDNAAHHPELATHPHHVHEGVETNVLPHEAVDIAQVLIIITGGSDVRVEAGD